MQSQQQTTAIMVKTDGNELTTAEQNMNIGGPIQVGLWRTRSPVGLSLHTWAIPVTRTPQKAATAFQRGSWSAHLGVNWPFFQPVLNI